MKKHFSRLLALMLVWATLAAMIAVPASAAGSYPLDCTIYYKDEEGNKVAPTKIWSMNAADTDAQAIKHYSPSVTGYVLKYSSDSYVTYAMMDKSFPASHYVRNGSATYTVYYVKVASSTINYLFEDRSGTAAPSKTVSGKQGSSYTVTSPAVTGYTPNRSSVTGTYGGGDQTVYYFEKTYTVSYDANGGMARTENTETVSSETIGYPETNHLSEPSLKDIRNPTDRNEGRSDKSGKKPSVRAELNKLKKAREKRIKNESKHRHKAPIIAKYTFSIVAFTNKSLWFRKHFKFQVVCCALISNLRNIFNNICYLLVFYV